MRSFLAFFILIFSAFTAQAQNFGNIPPRTMLGNPDPVAKKPAQPMPLPGIDARDFGLTTTADAGPPIRAAYAAAVSLGVPLLLRPAGAVYKILTVDPASFNDVNNGNAPYPNTTQPGLYFGSQTSVTHNVTVDFGGVTLQMFGNGCTTLPVGYDNDCRRTATVMFDNIRNLTVTGAPTFLGTNLAASGPSTENCGVALFNLVGFNIGRVNFTDYGGIGTGFCGDWLVHGRVSDAYMPKIGAFAADVAFLNDVVFDHFYARSADATGASAPQGGGVSITYDVPNKAQNKTGFVFDSTSNFTLMNSDLAGFNSGFFISEGSSIKSVNNYYHDMLGSPARTAQAAIGLHIHSNDYIADGGTHPHHILSMGDSFSNNGNATTGGGDFLLVWNAAIPTGSLSNVTLQGGRFSNPAGGAALQINAQTTHHDNFVATGNTGLTLDRVGLSLVTPQTDRVYGNLDVYSPPLGVGLPAGPGLSNLVTNAAPYPVSVRYMMGATPGAVCTVPRSGSPLCDNVNTGPNAAGSVMLNPGDGIYFETAIPTAWFWMSLGG